MKIPLFFELIVLSLLFSCDNTNERFKPPKLKLKNLETKQYALGGSLTDSMKNVFKQQTLSNDYVFEIHAYDVGIGLSEIKYSLDNGHGLLHDGSGTASANPIVKKDTVQTLFFRPDKSNGIYKVSFRAFNRYGVEGDAVALSLFVFDNLLPEAKLTYSPDTKNGPHALLLDASASYDRDGKYGGKVATYDFSIKENGKTHRERVYTPTLHVSFFDAGTYSVELVVYDNEGAPSKPVSLDVVAP